jgi:hypothetical protein
LDEIYSRIEDLAFEYTFEKDHILELFETVTETLTSFLNSETVNSTGLSEKLKQMLIERINLVFNKNRATHMFVPDDYKRFIDEIEKMNENATGELTWVKISLLNNASKTFDEIKKSKNLNEKEKQSLFFKFQYAILLTRVQSAMKSLIMSDLKKVCKEGSVRSVKDAEAVEQGLKVTEAMHESLKDKIWESMLPQKEYDEMIYYLDKNFKTLCLGNRLKREKKTKKN